MLARRALLGSVLWPAVSYAQRTDLRVVLVSNSSDIGMLQQIADLDASKQIEIQSQSNTLTCMTRLFDRPPAVALVSQAILLYLNKNGLNPQQQIRYIASYGRYQLYVLALQRITDIRQLAGAPVNLGPRGGDTDITASLLFANSSILINPKYLENDKALAALRGKEIAAMVMLAPNTSQFFFDVNMSDGVHFIPVIEYGNNVGIPSEIKAEDYPLLMGGESARGRGVATIAIESVLACRAWPVGSREWQALINLSNILIQFGNRLPGLSLTVDIIDWQRFEPIDNWIKRGQTGLIRR